MMMRRSCTCSRRLPSPRRGLQGALRGRAVCYTLAILRFRWPHMKVPFAQGAIALMADGKGPEPKSLSLVAPLAPEPTAIPVDASMSAGEVALTNLHALLADWLRHEPGARLGQDPEALHDLRVTARRMDATLSLFAPYLPEALVRARGKLKTLLRILGTPRDLDIQLGELTRISPQLPEGERPALDPLMHHLESERARARGRMLQALDSESTRGWIRSEERRVGKECRSGR